MLLIHFFVVELFRVGTRDQVLRRICAKVSVARGMGPSVTSRGQGRLPSRDQAAWCCLRDTQGAAFIQADNQTLIRYQHRTHGGQSPPSVCDRLGHTLPAALGHGKQHGASTANGCRQAGRRAGKGWTRTARQHSSPTCNPPNSQTSIATGTDCMPHTHSSFSLE
jgi:hypothetical protein